MKKIRNRQGFTLMETLITTSILVVVMLASVRFFSNLMPFIQRHRVRLQVQQEARICLDTITQRLRNGKARTLQISTPAEANRVPYSRVDFALQTPLASGAIRDAIYLSSGVVYEQESVPGVNRAPRALASHVTGLIFTGSSIDPGVVGVTLRIDAPWDVTGNSSHVTSLVTPVQIIHMVETQ